MHGLGKARSYKNTGLVQISIWHLRLGSWGPDSLSRKSTHLMQSRELLEKHGQHGIVGGLWQVLHKEQLVGQSTPCCAGSLQAVHKGEGITPGSTKHDNHSVL